MTRISFINPNLLKDITSKQQKRWDEGKFTILPIVGSVRKATKEDFDMLDRLCPNRIPVELDDPSFTPICWKEIKEDNHG